MTERFVIDTTSLISSFSLIFDRDNILSKKAYDIIYDSIYNIDSIYRLAIPSMVFIEIYRIWFLDDEFVKKFKFEIFDPIKNSPHVEIKEIDIEVMMEVLKIDDSLKNHEVNDKIIVASAISLNCPIITTDTSIIKFSENSRNNLAAFS
ncbi:MAG: PIN domain-containing protein [Balneolales bacterium]